MAVASTHVYVWVCRRFPLGHSAVVPPWYRLIICPYCGSAGERVTLCMAYGGPGDY